VSLRVAYDPAQAAHRPTAYMVNGVPQPAPDRPERIAALLDGVARLGATVETPLPVTMDLLHAVHDEGFLTFLETAARRWARLTPRADHVLPNVHALGRSGLVAPTVPASVAGQAGFYVGDGSAPIADDTWPCALASAASAVQAAWWVGEGARLSYALCRPPGHHAARDVAAGFCYLNNAALAVETIRAFGLRVAVLDIDLHHGNGTSAIYYASPDVLTVSLHADPVRFYPFFWGHAHETGIGAGLGANLNIPLPRGTGTSGYLEALDHALARIRGFGAEALVLSAGFDIHRDDPLQGFDLGTDDIGRIGAAIATLGLPTVVVQEGGYAVEVLSGSLTALIEGLGT
jgi:acetoin utilization deacetylase AcuC-like enzyme